MEFWKRLRPRRLSVVWRGVREGFAQGRRFRNLDSIRGDGDWLCDRNHRRCQIPASGKNRPDENYCDSGNLGRTLFDFIQLDEKSMARRFFADVPRYRIRGLAKCPTDGTDERDRRRNARSRVCDLRNCFSALDDVDDGIGPCCYQQNRIRYRDYGGRIVDSHHWHSVVFKGSVNEKWHRPLVCAGL